MLDDNQIYIVVDIESDGPVPGLYSMLSIGSVACNHEHEVGSFYRKLKPSSDASQDPATMKWWKEHAEAWQEVNADAQAPAKVMEQFLEWVTSFNSSPIFVASPLGFDYSFVSWYLRRYTGGDPFMDYSGVQRMLDLASFTAGKLDVPLSRARRSQLSSEFRVGMPTHSHNALDDARGYGVMLRNIINSKGEE